MKNIFRSRSLVIMLICLLVISGLIFYGAFHVSGKGAGIKDISKIAGTEVKEVIPAGQYKSLYILNGDKGVFLGDRNGQCDDWKLIFDNGTDRKLDYTGAFQKKNKSVTLMSGEKGYMLIKYNKYPEDINIMKYKYADIDEEGRYYLYLDEKEKKYFIKDMNGNEVFNIDEEETDGYDSVRFAGREGYIVKEYDDSDYLINMKNGRSVFKSHKTDKITGYKAGHWIIRKGEDISEYEVLDRNFKTVDSVATASDLYANEQVIVYQGGASHNHIIGAGGIIDDNQYGTDAHIAAEDSIAFLNGEDLFNYVAIKNNKAESLTESEYLSPRDFEDGFAPAYQGTEMTIEYGADLYIDGGEPKWGIVDKDMKPVTKFRFNGISKTENGYAVVSIGRTMAIIDLKEVQ